MMGGDITVEASPAVARPSRFGFRGLWKSPKTQGLPIPPHRSGGFRMGSCLLQCSSPLLALFVESLQCTNSGAIGGTADMPRTRRAYQSDVNDPGCVKTLQSREMRRMVFLRSTKIGGDENPRNELSALKDDYSIRSPRRWAFTRPRPKAGMTRTLADAAWAADRGIL